MGFGCTDFKAVRTPSPLPYQDFISENQFIKPSLVYDVVHVHEVSVPRIYEIQPPGICSVFLLCHCACAVSSF